MGEKVLRFLLWRLLAALAMLVGYVAVGWLLRGGPGRLLRGASAPQLWLSATTALNALLAAPEQVWTWRPGGVPLVAGLLQLSVLLAVALLLVRWHARSRRIYVRMRVEGHRTDQASAEALVRMHDVVQFLESPGRRGDSDAADGGDAIDAEERELAGVGAEELDVTF
jgi:hypothetical protein